MAIKIRMKPTPASMQVSAKFVHLSPKMSSGQKCLVTVSETSSFGG